MSDNKVLVSSEERRKITIADEIDNETIALSIKYLQKFIDDDNEDDEKEKDYKREPIHLYIQTYGGYIYDMWGLIDVILNSKTPIYTHCQGYAMSAGFLIFIAGNKRYMTKHSTLMCHQISSGSYGVAQKLIEDIEQIKLCKKEMEDYIVERCPKITRNKLQEINEKKLDWYIKVDEAIRLGIAELEE